MVYPSSRGGSRIAMRGMDLSSFTSTSTRLPISGWHSTSYLVKRTSLGTSCGTRKTPRATLVEWHTQHETLYLLCGMRRLSSARPLSSARSATQSALIEAARKAVSRTKTIEDTRSYGAWVRAQDSLSGGEAMYNRLDDGGRVYRLVSMAWPSKKQAPDHYFVPLTHPVTGRPCPVPARGWRNPPDTMQALLDAGRIEFGDDDTVQPQRRYFLDENMDENVPSVLRSL